MSYFINASFVDGQFYPIDPTLPIGFYEEVDVISSDELYEEDEELVLN